MGSHFHWQFHKPTITKGKLPNDWEKQDHMMVLQIAYLVRIYNLPPSLVVNIDQT
jgi:hypothetical protein